MRHISSLKMVFYTSFALTASGWAQKVDTNFSPSRGVYPSARSVPATVTTQDDASLTAKGYVKIGSVSASQNGKTRPEVPQVLNGAALAAAAYNGGDIVRFEKEGVQESVDTPTHHMGKPTSHIPKQKYANAYDIPWEETFTNTEYSVWSTGSVWRYDPEWAAKTGRVTLLVKAAKTDDLLTVTRLLENDPALALNARDEDGYTALQLAASNEIVELAKLLLARGADINATDKDGETPLALAEKKGNRNMVKLLRKHGARK